MRDEEKDTTQHSPSEKPGTEFGKLGYSNWVYQGSIIDFWILFWVLWRVIGRKQELELESEVHGCTGLLCVVFLWVDCICRCVYLSYLVCLLNWIRENDFGFFGFGIGIGIGFLCICFICVCVCVCEMGIGLDWIMYVCILASRTRNTTVW